MYKTAAALLALASLTVAAAAQEEVTSHPLVTAYEGAEFIRGEYFDYDEYQLITGFDFDTRETVSETIAGRITRLYHDNPDDRSEFEIFENYREAFEAAGYEAIWSCAGDGECFTGSTRNAFRNHNGFMAMNGGNSRYSAGRLVYEDRVAFVAFGVGRHGTSIDIIETSEMDRDMVTISAEALAAGLDAEGHVRVDGLLFAHDEAELLPESAEALQALADLLNDRPDLSLYVVGHTDMSGSLSYNIGLSQRRAASVVAALVENYAIAAARLEAQGVGPLAPEATNASDVGRQTNRRVEIVVR